MSCVTAVEGEWLAEAGPMFFSVKESFETALLRRQKDRQEQAKMEKQMKRKEEEEAEAEEEQNRKRTSSMRRSQAVATPGRRSAGATPRFMPKKRGRLGL